MRFYGDTNIHFGHGAYDLLAPEPLPDAAKREVQRVLETGSLFRYLPEQDTVSNLENEFAHFIGVPFAVACNSGGCGLFLALKALGISADEKVLVNAWTLSPVPGAIVHANAQPVFVKSDPETLTIDLEDLERCARETSARCLLLSYMRGHVPDMDKVMAIVKRHELLLIEDCAHTLGAQWSTSQRWQHLGSFGDIAVWSLQTNKSINAGEGGMIATRRQDLASYLIIATGSYGHFEKHQRGGDAEVTRKLYPNVPNCSMRMSALTAAVARPQLAQLDRKLDSWQKHYLLLSECFASSNLVEAVPLTEKHAQENLRSCSSSLQLRLKTFTFTMMERLVAQLCHAGIPVSWYAGPPQGFVSTVRDWHFAGPEASSHWAMSASEVLTSIIDLPLYHTTTWQAPVMEALAGRMLAIIEAIASRGP